MKIKLDSNKLLGFRLGHEGKIGTKLGTKETL